MTDKTKHSDGSQPSHNHVANLDEFIRWLEPELRTGGGATLDELYNLAVAIRADLVGNGMAATDSEVNKKQLESAERMRQEKINEKLQ